MASTASSTELAELRRLDRYLKVYINGLRDEIDLYDHTRCSEQSDCPCRYDATVAVGADRTRKAGEAFADALTTIHVRIKNRLAAVEAQ